MAKLELNLLDNAIDSLNEALKKYSDGLDGDATSFKFAILHFSHFIELVFKYYVSQSHELLVYKNPFAKNLEQTNTIGIWDALQFLINEGHEIPKQFRDDLEWFKKLRNSIEHSRFEMDTDEVKEALGRLMQALNEFNDLTADFSLKDIIDPALLTTFELLADEYEAKLARAIEEAGDNAVGGTEYGHYCWACSQAGTVSLSDNKYKCHFCEEETGRIDCCICGQEFPTEEGYVWNADHPPHIDYICENCNDRMSHGWD